MCIMNLMPEGDNDMYYDRSFPFYMAYSTPLLYEGEAQQEKEFQLMKSYYPETVKKLQDKVEEECDRLDYPGSPIYDEYPDRLTLNRICRKISDKMEDAEVSVSSLNELAQILLFHEIYRRRCRRCRSRYF